MHLCLILFIFNCAFVPDVSAEKPFVLTDVLNKW